MYKRTGHWEVGGAVLVGYTGLTMQTAILPRRKDPWRGWGNLFWTPTPQRAATCLTVLCVSW
jgi:hypothetical protein